MEGALNQGIYDRDKITFIIYYFVTDDCKRAFSMKTTIEPKQMLILSIISLHFGNNKVLNWSILSRFLYFLTLLTLQCFYNGFVITWANTISTHCQIRHLNAKLTGGVGRGDGINFL